MRAADIDAATIDAYGTLLTIVDPFPQLQQLLPQHERAEIERAFHREGEFYRAHSYKAHDAPTLAALREDCVRVFNGSLGSALSADEYVAAMKFEPLPGVRDALDRLRGLGLTLAVVGNWDWSLHERLEETGLARFFAAVVPAANKPQPDGILRALAEISVQPARALHIGDEDNDEVAARAAGAQFAPAPLTEVVASLT